MKCYCVFIKNHIMLNGDDDDNSKKLIGFSSKTTTLHVQHNYFLLHFFAVVTRFMEEMSYVFTNNFLLNFLFSSLLLIFTLLVASISHFLTATT